MPMEIYANEEHHWNVIDDHLKNGKAVKIWWHKIRIVLVFEFFVVFHTYFFTAVIKNGVEVKFLVNEHASHKYLMKKYLRKLSEKLRDKRRNANIQLKFFSVSKCSK